MTVKVIFSFSCCSSLYIAFAILVYGELDTVLAAAKCIKIVIGGVVVAIVVTFIYQLKGLNDSDLNFVLTI